LTFFASETVRGHFQPFTDVLREIWPAVTRKIGQPQITLMSRLDFGQRLTPGLRLRRARHGWNG